MTDEQIKSLAEVFSAYRDSKELTIRGQDVVRFGRVMLELGKQTGPADDVQGAWPPVAAELLFAGRA